MELDRSKWTDAPEYVDDHPPRQPEPIRYSWSRRPYSAISTIWPRAYSFQYGPGTFGQTLTISARGSDAIPLHGIAANVAVDTVTGNPQLSASYAYYRLPFDVKSTIFRVLSPRKDYRINDDITRTVEQTIGWSNSLSYSINRAFDSFSFGIGYTAAIFDRNLPVPQNLDPQSTITINPTVRGFLGTVRGYFGYSNMERYNYSVGNSRGTSVSAGFELAGPATASEYSVYSFNASVARYTQTPWHPDHTIVARYAGAATGGTYPRQNVYYTGGFVDLPLIDALQNSIFQGGFLLRGYPANVYSGKQYHLANLEYRAPIWHPERGVSTLPVFFNRLSALAFLDYGGAFDKISDDWKSGFHTAVGGELLFDATIGYFMSMTARLGYAKGMSALAYEGGQWYLVLTSPF